MIEFRVFGPTSLRGPEGNELLSVLSRPKLLSFLLVLANLPENGFIRRENLMGLLWSELDPARARATLRQFIYRIRGSLGADAIEARGEDEIRLNPSVVWCDVQAFRSAVEQGREEEALLLYRGEMMEGFYPPNAPEFERWLDRRRTELRKAAADAARSLAGKTLDAGNRVGAGHWARKAADLSRYDETFSRACMAFLARLGDSGGAIEVYQALERRLSDDLGLPPSDATRELVSSIRDGAGWTGVSEEWSLPDPEAESSSEAASETRQRESDTASTPSSPPAGKTASTGPSTPNRRVRATRSWAVPGLLLFLLPLLGGYLGFGMLVSEDGGSSRASLSGDDALPTNVLAALPLSASGLDEETTAVTAGIYEGLLDHLSRVSGLTLISRRTMSRYRDTDLTLEELGRELGAGSVLRGVIEWDGSNAAMRLTLLEAASGKTLWSGAYDRPMRDMGDVQGEIALQVSAALGAGSSLDDSGTLPRAAPRSMAAYRLYLRSRGMGDSYATLPDLAVEEQLLRQALAGDPEFAAAWSALAWNFARRVDEFGQPEFWADSALVAAQTALSLDPGSAEGHLVMGSVYVEKGFLDRGEESLKQALALDANMALAHFLLGKAELIHGRFDLAILSLRRALRRDPGSPSIQGYIALAYSFLGEIGQALEWMELEIQSLDEESEAHARMEAVSEVWRGNPESAFRFGLRMVEAAPEVPRVRAFLSDLALQVGRCAPAVEHARRAMAMASNPQDVRYAFFASTVLGKALILCGSTAEGIAELSLSRDKLLCHVEEGSQDPFLFLELSAVYEALGDRETAVVWMHKAYQQGFRQLRILETHPLFDTLRKDPEVEGIVAQVREDLAEMRARLRAAGEEQASRPESL